MIATDTSSLIAFFQGGDSEDIVAIRQSIRDTRLILPPVVLTEMLSDPHAQSTITDFLEAMPLLDLYEGFWQRAAGLRQTILKRGLKSRLADAFIAQSCIDHDVPLITRDKDFRHYAIHCGLKLYAQNQAG